MLIRTQNKKGIVNLNSIDTIDVYDKQVRYFSGGGVESMGLLGQYSTEEKAIKVLDMIQDAYERYNFFSITYTDGVLRALERQNGLEETRKQISSVFQMPQDSEV